MRNSKRYRRAASTRGMVTSVPRDRAWPRHGRSRDASARYAARLARHSPTSRLPQRGLLVVELDAVGEHKQATEPLAGAVHVAEAKAGIDQDRARARSLDQEAVAD